MTDAKGGDAEAVEGMATQGIDTNQNRNSRVPDHPASPRCSDSRGVRPRHRRRRSRGGVLHFLK